MQYLPTVSIITVEAESLTLLCLLALGPWSGALLELSCSLAVCFHRPPAFLKQQRPLTTAQVAPSFLARTSERSIVRCWKLDRLAFCRPPTRRFTVNPDVLVADFERLPCARFQC